MKYIRIKMEKKGEIPSSQLLTAKKFANMNGKKPFDFIQESLNQGWKITLAPAKRSPLMIGKIG